MPGLRTDQLKLPNRRPITSSWLWREWCFLRVAARRFGIRFSIMVVLLCVGARLFQHFEPEKHHTFIKAVFMTWCLVFGQPPEDFPVAPVLQALFFVVPVLGLTVIIEGIVDFALLLRERRSAERSWCVTMASSLSNHIVLVGFGRLGYRTYRLLHRLGEAVVVIEGQTDNEFLDDLRRDGTPLLLGDARREAILGDANVGAAKSIILATNDDLANLEVALDARRLNPHIRIVLRMFDQNMADKIRDGFNIHIAMSQAAISAPSFATAALERAIITSFVVGDRLVVMLRWLVRDGSPLVGKTIGQTAIEMGVGVLEHCRAGREAQLFPAPDITLGVNDELVVQGPYEKMNEMRRFAQTPGR